MQKVGCSNCHLSVSRSILVFLDGIFDVKQHSDCAQHEDTGWHRCGRKIVLQGKGMSAFALMKARYGCSSHPFPLQSSCTRKDEGCCECVACAILQDMILIYREEAIIMGMMYAFHDHVLDAVCFRISLNGLWRLCSACMV